MYKEAYDASYQYGVRMALESTGVIKTAGAAEAAASEGPGLLAKLLQMAKGAPGQIAEGAGKAYGAAKGVPGQVGSAASGAYGATPSWAKGMAAGGAGGAGLGAVAGDDLSDILMGGAGGAALGGALGGGGAALSRAAQKPGAAVAERLGLGNVGKAKSRSAFADEAHQMMGPKNVVGPRLPENLSGTPLNSQLQRFAESAQQGIGEAASGQAAQLSPELMKILGLAGGGAGLAGSMG